MSGPFRGIALPALLALTGCHAQPTQTVERTVTVNGDPATLAQFVAAQKRERPALGFRTSGREARSAIPDAYTGKDIVAVTHAALAAGLNYSVTTHAVTVTPPHASATTDAGIDTNGRR